MNIFEEALGLLEAAGKKFEESQLFRDIEEVLAKAGLTITPIAVASAEHTVNAEVEAAAPIIAHIVDPIADAAITDAGNAVTTELNELATNGTTGPSQ